MSVGIIMSTIQDYPKLHNLLILKILGWMITGLGLIIAVLGFKELGLEKSLGKNFFEEKTKIVKSGIYQYISEPEEYGFWLMMVGFALGTASIYNLVYAIELIILMIPHQKIENLPLNKKKNSK